MCVEGISFLDVNSLWLDACGGSSLSVLQRIIDAGCNVAEKDEKNGRNCLFHVIFGSMHPENSCDFEKLQYLLSIFDDIYARDAHGRTIFDCVKDFQGYALGSYKRDLWYCALDRAGIDVSSQLVQYPRVSSYTMLDYAGYTPEHYHALKHLGSWDESNFRSQMDHLLQEIPLDEDEALEMERLRREEMELDL